MKFLFEIFLQQNTNLVESRFIIDETY